MNVYSKNSLYLSVPSEQMCSKNRQLVEKFTNNGLPMKCKYKFLSFLIGKTNLYNITRATERIIMDRGSDGFKKISQM